MNKKIVIIIFTFLLTGCYDSKELNSIAILVGSEVNKVDGEYVINAQIVNPQSPDKTITVESPFIMYTGKGKTLHEAYRSIKNQSARFLYPNHLQLLVIDEELAKDDVSSVIDFYLRLPSVRTEFNVIIGRGENILNATTPIDSISSTSIVDTLKINTKYLGIANMVTFNELANMNLNKNLEIVLPSIIENEVDDESKTLENTEKTTIESLYSLGTLGIFRENKLVGYLSQEDSLAYNIIKGKDLNILLTYECDDGLYFTYEITDIKTKMELDKMTLHIDVSLLGNINETQCSIKLDSEDGIKEIEEAVNKHTKELIIGLVNNLQDKYNTDALGIIDLMYKKEYDTYIDVHKNWSDKGFKNLEVIVNVQAGVNGKGNVMEGNNEKS